MFVTTYIRSIYYDKDQSGTYILHIWSKNNQFIKNGQVYFFKKLQQKCCNINPSFCAPAGKYRYINPSHPQFSENSSFNIVMHRGVIFTLIDLISLVYHGNKRMFCILCIQNIMSQVKVQIYQVVCNMYCLIVHLTSFFTKGLLLYGLYV